MEESSEEGLDKDAVGLLDDERSQEDAVDSEDEARFSAGSIGSKYDGAEPTASSAGLLFESAEAIFLREAGCCGFVVE